MQNKNKTFLRKRALFFFTCRPAGIVCIYFFGAMAWLLLSSIFLGTNATGQSLQAGYETVNEAVFVLLTSGLLYLLLRYWQQQHPSPTQNNHGRSLTESEQRFRGLVEQSLAGIYIIQNDKYVYANPRLAEILGYLHPDELHGRSPLDFIRDDDRDQIAEGFHKLLSNGEKHVNYEAHAIRHDGVHIEIGGHGALTTYQGKPAIIGLVQDVTDKRLAQERMNSYVQQLQSSLMQTVEVATVLSEMRDPYTAGHERKVAEIAVAIGQEMGLDEHTVEGLRVAGFLHDIGKINIPSEILAKPGRLTQLEYEIIQGHPESGYSVLKDVDFPWPVAEIALQHHERIDGTGYPHKLKGDEILLQARITAVADVVEAMASHRPYRPGLGIEAALAEIERGKGTIYDSEASAACLTLFREKGYSLPE